MRRKVAVFYLGLLVLAFSVATTAHEKQVHTYLVIQAFNLLEKHYPLLASTSMAQHLGHEELAGQDCNGVGNPWANGTITTGAFLEDCQDMVYHATDIRTITCSHFWDADAGDEAKSHFCTPECNDWDNAFMKAKHYMKGDYDLMLYCPMCHPPNKAVITATLFLRYNSLVDLYKTGRLYITGFNTNEGDFYYDTRYLLNDEMLEGSGYTVEALSQTIPWEVLGRMAHLLGDMGVPAHAHVDAHCDIFCSGGTDDFEDWEKDHYKDTWYEQFEGEPSPVLVGWNADYADRIQGGPLDPYEAVPSHDDSRMLRYLFYTTNQIADCFPSNNSGGDQNWQGYDGDDYSVLNYIQEISPFIKDWMEPYSQNRYTYLYSMRSIAGLLYWFAVETGQLNRIGVETSFGGGSVYVNTISHPSGYSFLSNGGETFSLNVDDQNWPNSKGESIPRIFHDWTESVDGVMISTTTMREWNNIPIDRTAIYTADMNMRFDVTIGVRHVLEQGADGTYTVNNATQLATWEGSFIQTVTPPIDIEAVPAPGSIFVSWNDGVVTSRRSLTPTDNVQLYAIFKLPLHSTISNATANGAQRKVVADGSGKLHLVYESANSILEATSPDWGITWANESVIALASSSDYYHMPSAVLSPDGSHVFTIYDMYSQPDIHTINWTENTSNSNVWELGSSTGDPSFQVNPIAILAKGGWANSNTILSAVWQTSGSSPGIQFAIGSANTYSDWPNSITLVNDNTVLNVAYEVNTFAADGGNQYEFYLAWESSTGIQFMYGQLNQADEYSPRGNVSWSGPYTVVTNSGNWTNRNPVIAGASEVFVAYVHGNGSQGNITVQELGTSKQPLVGSPITLPNPSGADKYPSSPSMTDYRDNGNRMYDLTLVWNTNNGLIASEYKNDPFGGRSWSNPYQFGQVGQNPNLDVSVHSPDNRVVVYCGGTSAPFTIGSQFVPSAVFVTTQLADGWDMISTPTSEYNNDKSTLYPDAISHAFMFNGSNYQINDALNPGPGYYLKFPSSQNGWRTVAHSGAGISDLKIDVISGWNLFGSISSPLGVDKVISWVNNTKETSNQNIVSKYMKYVNGGYQIADYIYPGGGYFVKTAGAGQIELTTNNNASIPPPITQPQPPPAPGAPSIPTLYSPTNGSSGQPLTPVLCWNSSSGANNYHLQVATSSNFNTIVYDLSATVSTSASVYGLNYSTTYYWKVNASNDLGSSNWSSIWWFTTQDPPPPPPPCDCCTNSVISLDQITVSDAAGNRQHMFTANASVPLALGFTDFDMPPEPRDSIFNVRFHSGKFIHKLYPDSGLTAIPIRVRFARFPIRVHWDLKESNGVRYWLINPRNLQQRIELHGKDSLTLPSVNNGTLGLVAQPDRIIPPCYSKTIETYVDQKPLKPTEYSLGQNYPNPYNPTTQIIYGLPEDSYVLMKVYNVLGQETAILVDGFQQAGFKSVEFDASRLPSGIYFYKLVAGKFTSMKKMVLVK